MLVRAVCMYFIVGLSITTIHYVLGLLLNVKQVVAMKPARVLFSVVVNTVVWPYSLYWSIRAFIKGRQL